jgi:hypothetical protein
MLRHNRCDSWTIIHFQTNELVARMIVDGLCSHSRFNSIFIASVPSDGRTSPPRITFGDIKTRKGLHPAERISHIGQ